MTTVVKGLTLISPPNTLLPLRLHSCLHCLTPPDYLASEGTRAGEKLLDLLTVGVKDLSGRDITPDYTAELNHVHALLTAQQEHYCRAARQADLYKLRLQQNIQLLTCQRDVRQVRGDGGGDAGGALSLSLLSLL